VTVHEHVVRSVLAGFRGRKVETAGDSFPVSTVPEGAIRCGLAVVEALGAKELPIRVGIHSGEVVMNGNYVRGLAVHAAARIVARAGAGKIVVSGCHPRPCRGRHRIGGSSLGADTASKEACLRHLHRLDPQSGGRRFGPLPVGVTGVLRLRVGGRGRIRTAPR
jgi:hypothetical protein